MAELTTGIEKAGIRKDDRPLIVALDYPSAEQALAMAGQLDPKRCRVKVGKELFTREGPAVVKALHEQGFEVFLDLKFHDIPNTVAKAVVAAAEMGVWMVNVHASGGAKMMSTAKQALAPFGNDAPLLIAVTVLTSMNEAELRSTGIQQSPLERVQMLAEQTYQAGLDGVVCSAQETKQLRRKLGDNFALVTPGIRPAGSDVGDQSRIATPAQAMADGSHYLVMGRPITQAPNPMDALDKVLADLA